MTIYRCKEHYDMYEVDQEFVIVDASQFTVTVLNEVGSYCWDMLRMGCTKEELISAITENYTVGEMDIVQDIEDFLNELQMCGLVEEYVR